MAENWLGKILRTGTGPSNAAVSGEVAQQLQREQVSMLTGGGFTTMASAVGFGRALAAPPYQYREMAPDMSCTVVMDSLRRPHSFNKSPAVKYSDGVEEYAWHGVQVPGWMITHSENINIKLIDGEVNTEVRRVMVEIYGQQRFMQECGAELVNKDEVGELYRKTSDISGVEDFCFVRLINSTPEPDGTSKIYYLRVPPGTFMDRNRNRIRTIATATEAVAWTFGLTAAEYKLAVQT